MNTSAKSSTGGTELERVEDTSKQGVVDPMSSTTDRNSVSTSASSRTSAGASTFVTSAISGKNEASSEGASDISISSLVPTLISRARTDRQMQIEQKILELQGRLIALSGPEGKKTRARAELQEKIQKVKDLRESEWAFGGKGELPDVLID
ncbi:hypothetical protein AAF712_002510 [Marasmius tenuissimus]|uniref:Uncharacterized protein n=1 Tax=Marasmius tenuissimus TaxID=585030 RepID=A0ABR3ABD6_9AGAR